MNITLTKTPTGFFPADHETEEFASRLRLGEVIHGDFKRMRNYKFHRKFFALLNFAYEYWEPGEVDSKHGVPEKNFDRFREDLTILAGFYHTTVRLDNTVRVEADSISFGSMDQPTFEKLYNAVLDVIMAKIFIGRSREEINNLIEQFAST